MANVTITQLPNATLPLDGTELIPIVQSGVTVNAPSSSVASAGGNSVTPSSVTTFTNKTMSGASNTFTNISLSSSVTGTLSTTNGGTGLITYSTGDIIYASASNTLSKLTIGSLNQVLSVSAGGIPSWKTLTTGSGTVTTVSVVSANGFTGTVANPTTTPAITLTTSITGVLKGDGTAISAATAGTDYVAPGGALGTPSSGTLTNCTFPTLNQNTSGSAASLSATLVATSGGTGQSTYAVGDLLQGATTNTLAKLAAVATGNALISGGVTTASSWGKIGLTTHVSGTLPIANGGTNATTAAGANANLQGFTTTATAGATTALTNTSTYYQYFTGTLTQTITLPLNTDIQNGWSFHIANNSTGNLTINSNSGALVNTVLPGTTVHVTCVDATVNTAAAWDSGTTDFGAVTGTGSVVLAASPTITGTPSIGTAGSTTTLLGNISAATSNQTVTLSPTGTGTVAISPVGALTINPTAASTINNTSIGATTRSTGAFTTLGANGAVTVQTTTNNQSYTTTGAGTITMSSGTAGSIDNMNIGATTAGTGRFSTLAATGVFTASAGTAALPSIVTSSGSTSGIYSSTANVLGVSISATSIGTFTSTGLNSMAIGATTASTGAFTSLTATSRLAGGVLSTSGGLTALTALTLSASNQSFGNALASQTLATGQVYRVRAFGTLAAISSANVRQVQFTCLWGATALTSITSGTVLASTAQTTNWNIEFTLTASSATAIWTTGFLNANVQGGAAPTALLTYNATAASTTGLTSASSLTLNAISSGTATGDVLNVQSITIERLV